MRNFVFCFRFYDLVIYELTHWGRVTHICVNNLTTIGSVNGSSPGRRKAITWTNAGILLIGPLGTNFSEILIEIPKFSFKKMHLKVSSGKWRPFCLGLNELMYASPGFSELIIMLIHWKGIVKLSLQWRHNGRNGISNHQPHDCLLNRLFRCRSKKTSKLCVTGLCAGNSLVTSEFPAQRASNGENVSIWWRHHGAVYNSAHLSYLNKKRKVIYLKYILYYQLSYAYISVYKPSRMLSTLQHSTQQLKNHSC